MVRRGRKLGPPVRPEVSPVIFAAVVLGETGLYKWQMRALERAARGKRVTLRAANGSGKTDKLIGILALWFMWRYLVILGDDFLHYVYGKQMTLSMWGPCTCNVTPEPLARKEKHDQDLHFHLCRGRP